MSTSGSGTSPFAYTGEQQDGDMVYLRSRYYNAADGRFQSRDTWGGDANRPMSMNRWGYVEGNPVNLTDPSGHCVNADGSITMWEWPWFNWGPCSSNSNPPSTPPTSTPSPTPSPTCTPTLPPTITPTPLCPVCSSNQYAQMLYDAVINHKNDLPPGYSVALLFAVAAVESGGNNPAYQNSTTHGGAFQLRQESGHYAPNGYYEDTPAGYEQNVKDAIATINDNYGYAQTAKNPGTYYNFLYTETYPQCPDEITAAITVLFYNGGTHWWDKNNPQSYWYHPTSQNQPYVGNIAKMLGSYVPKNFGFDDPALVDILTSLQAVVNAYVPPP